jgi:hypothetical protein
MLAFRPADCYDGLRANGRSDRGTRSAYSRMLGVAGRVDARVRLSRRGDGWGLTVTVLQDGEGELARAAGFFFSRIEELDAHALLILPWLQKWESVAALEDGE